MVGLTHAMPLAQVVLDARKQLGSHLGVGQCTVCTAGAWQLEKIHQ